MVGIVERRVPERHDRIAHVLVDGAALLKDHVGERRQQRVDEVGQLVRGEPLRNGGEVPDVAEQDGELLYLAAELEPVGVGDQLVDHRWRDVVREGEAHLRPLLLDAAVDVERRRRHQDRQGQRRVGRVEEEVELREGEPCAEEDRRDRRDPHRGGGERGEMRHDRGEHDPGEDDEDQLDRRSVIRPGELASGEDVLERLRLDLDPGDRRVERGGAEIVEAGSAGPDQDDGAGDVVRIVGAVEDVRGGNESRRVGRPEAEPDRAVGVGRELDVADLDVVEAGGAAEGLLAARVRGLEDEGRGALRDAERFRREARHQLLADPEYQPDPAHHLVAVRHPVQRADAERLGVEDRQVAGRSGEVRDERPRVVPGHGEAGLHRRRHSLLTGEHRREHRGARSNRLGEARVIARPPREGRRQRRGLLRRQRGEELLRRGLVGFREQHVEGDRGGALVAERL